MSRFLFVAGFVVLVGLQTAFIGYALQSNLIPVAMEDTDISLQRSTSLVETSHRLDELAVKEKAEHVADQASLRQAMVADYEGDWKAKRHREVHKHLETEQIRFDQWADDVEDERNLDLGLLKRRPLELDMFMALDRDGRLVATLGRGLAHLMGDDFGSQFDTVGQAMNNDETTLDMWNWAWRTDDESRLYVVAITPIHSPDEKGDGEEVVGTVVLGYQVTDGVAERRRSLVADGLGEDNPSEEQAGPTTEREEVQAPDLAFFRGDRFYSSTLAGQERNALHGELFGRHDILAEDEPEKILDTQLAGENHRTMVRFFPGQFETDNPAGVVVTTSRDEALAPFEKTRSTLLTVGGATLVVGIVLILLFFHFFLKPFGRLEEGIQEIISGDKDYTFETGESHDIADNLAHHLNLLSAYLQGKPMPDEEQSVGGWDGLAGDEPDTGGDGGGDAAVAGVPMDLGSDSGADGDADDSDDDDAEKSDRSREDEPAGEPT